MNSRLEQNRCNSRAQIKKVTAGHIYTAKKSSFESQLRKDVSLPRMIEMLHLKRSKKKH